MRALALGRCLGASLCLTPIASDLLIRATGDAGDSFPLSQRLYCSSIFSFTANMPRMPMQQAGLWINDLLIHLFHTRYVMPIQQFQEFSSSFHVPEGYNLPAGVMALQNLPADAVAEAAIAAALLLEHTPLGAGLLLRPGALTALLDAVFDENSTSLPEHAHRKASFSGSGNTQFLSCRLCQSLRTCWRSRVLAAASFQALSLINEGFYKMKLKQHWHECPCRHNAYVVTVTASLICPESLQEQKRRRRWLALRSGC